MSKKLSERLKSGRRLRKLRIAAALSGRELASMAGIDSQHVYKMENHTGISTLPVAHRLATALGISLEGLLGRYTGFDGYPPQVTELIGQGAHPIQALRHYHEMSAEQLATACGVSVQHITSLENAKVFCRPELLLKLAVAMQVSADVLGQDILMRGRAARRLPQPSPRQSPATLRQASQNQAEGFARSVRPHIEEILHQKPSSCQEVADRLNELGLLTRQSGPWTPKDAWNIIRNLDLSLPQRRLLIRDGAAYREACNDADATLETATAPEEKVSAGSRLRYFRLRKNISIQELSARTGISANSLSLMETKRGCRSLTQAIRLASALDISLEAFVGQSAGASDYPLSVSEWIKSGIHPLRALRWYRRSSLDELTAQTGISAVHLSQMERGQRFCRTEAFVDLAAALEISADLLAEDTVKRADKESRSRSRQKFRRQRRTQLQEFAELMRPHLEAALKEGPKSYAEMARILDQNQLPAISDGNWTTQRVQTLTQRLGLKLPRGRS